MTCPNCQFEGNDEFADFIEREEISAINFEGYDEKYNIVCEKCGQKYVHIEQYEISSFGSTDKVME